LTIADSAAQIKIMNGVLEAVLTPLDPETPFLPADRGLIDDLVPPLDLL
jgi:hypothetical protein